MLVSKGKRLSTKRWKKLLMAYGMSRNEANYIIYGKKLINQCFERHNREEKLKASEQRGNQVL